MRVQSITPTDNNDFFAQFKSFLAGLEDYGWVIDAQSADEIYIHNGDGDHYAFRQQEIIEKQSRFSNDFLAQATHILMCLSNGGYDGAANFYHQPNSSINTLGYTYDKAINYFINCLIYKDITEAIFIADEKNLIISAKRTDPGIMLFILITKLKKTFDWNGGKILSSSNAILHTILDETIRIKYAGLYWEWWSMQNEFANDIDTLQATPFPFPILRYGLDTSPSRASSVFYFNNSYMSAGNYLYNSDNPVLKIENTPFITNLPYGGVDGSITSAIPFDPIRMAIVSRYTGLHAMITPHYFFKNNENRFVLAGVVDKIKVVTRGNLIHGQRIWYGDREYLILDYHVLSNSTYLLAVDITEES